MPLEAINVQSAREKSIRHGHPSTLHLWWARRPLATARAVLFAQLVDDPSVRFDEYRDEAARRGDSDPDAYAERAVAAERQRLFRIIENIVDWNNLNREDYWEEARAEILKSTDGHPPAILDPFAGGGTIPLEAQRLGLQAHASDLNPVAVLINKALIEIPPSFAGNEPVFPGAAGQRNAWPKATGLAEDVRRYGQWMRDEAEKRIGYLYPKANLSDGSEATVVAWIWARTITCPNPACGIEMPLVRSWWLGKKKGKEAFVAARVVNGRVEYEIGHDPKTAPKGDDEGTVSRTGATCVACRTAVPLEHVREVGRNVGFGTELIAIVAENKRARVFLPPSGEQRAAARIELPAALPTGKLPTQALGFRVQAYGMTEWSQLFTNRQLVALTTFADLVGEARERVLADANAAGLVDNRSLEEGGSGARAYADAVATYLGLGVSRLSDIANAFTRWENTKEQVRNLFGRQAISMVWDFGEAPPFGKAAGAYEVSLGSLVKALERLPSGIPGKAVQADAASRSYAGLLISTDPPYYDNIGYSDLSDFFYVWLRRSLREIYPTLLGTVQVPKAEELVANPFRHGGAAGAREFFETGFEHVFAHARENASNEYPIAVYYAFKQSESDGHGEASTGWETILGSMVTAGWSVTATWPVRSELANRMRGQDANALASSIVLALRPRPEDAPIIDRKGLLAELREHLGKSLREMLQGTIAPVDLAQAAIGPGMAVFSKYATVIEPSGRPMRVHDALVHINAILDEVVRDQEGDFDTDTRWCVTWFEQYGFDSGPFGTADTLARAKATSVDLIARGGAATSGGNKVRLLAPDELPSNYDPSTDDRISLWEVVMHAARSLSAVGLDDTGRIVAGAMERGVDLTAAKELAVRLYQVSNQRGGMTRAAGQFNLLGASWSDVIAAAQTQRDRMEADAIKTKTAVFDFDGLEEA